MCGITSHLIATLAYGVVHTHAMNLCSDETGSENDDNSMHVCMWSSVTCLCVCVSVLTYPHVVCVPMLLISSFYTADRARAIPYSFSSSVNMVVNCE